MHVPSIVGAISVIVLAAALACGPKQVVQTTSTVSAVPPPVAECLFFHSTASLADTIVVALFDEVDPAHAPQWRNESERLVFHHLYESVNLVRTCASPGLLSGSQISDDGRVNSLRLRDDARFWDGTPVTSRDLAEALGRARMFTNGIDSITTPDDSSVEIHVADRNFEWKAIQSPSLAITKRSSGAWPMGTGPYRVVDGGSDLLLQPSFDANGPAIRFTNVRGVDARDVLDPAFTPRIDLAFIEDPNIVEYAKRQGRFQATEVRHTKAYFLLSITRVRALLSDDSVPTVPDSLTYSIARDAVRSASARALTASQGPRFNLLGGCNLPLGGAPVGIVPTTRRILYDASDPTARDLADRIIALAATTSRAVTVLCAAIPGLNSASPRPVAIGVSAGELATSMAVGSDFAYIVSLPLGRPESCYLPLELMRMAPWLGAGSAPLHLKTVPLVTTGPYVASSQSGSGATFALNMNVGGSFLIVGTNRMESP